VIAKPLVADGSAKSHKMALVYNHDGLNKLKPPIVLQEFVNHGGVIFKVYVVGEYVRCVKRKSLPDVSEERLGVSEGVLSFSQVSNIATNENVDGKYYKMMHLNLFNFDVIRDARFGNRYLIIDINYFPGYAKMPCYEAVLTDFFLDVVTRSEKEVVKVNNCEKDTIKIVSNNTCCSDGDEIGREEKDNSR